MMSPLPWQIEALEFYTDQFRRGDLAHGYIVDDSAGDGRANCVRGIAATILCQEAVQVAVKVVPPVSCWAREITPICFGSLPRDPPKSKLNKSAQPLLGAKRPPNKVEPKFW